MIRVLERSAAHQTPREGYCSKERAEKKHGDAGGFDNARSRNDEVS